MRTPPATARTPRRPPPRSRRSSKAGAARGAGSSAPFAEWIDTVSSLLNDADPATRERGLVELQRGFEDGPGPYAQDKRELLAAVLQSAAHGKLGTQPEAHLVLARIQLRSFGDRAGAEKSLWYATFGAARLASTNRSADRDRAAQVNREASRIWGDLGNGYQRDARNAIGRYFTARLASPIAALPVLRAWPDVGRGEGSSRRQPAMGPPQRTIPIPALLKGANARPGESPPPRMSGLAVRRMSAVDALHALGALVGVLRRAPVLSAYLRECESARANRDMLPTPNLPSVVREFEASLRQALANPNLTAQQRDYAERLAGSLDLGYMLETSLAYWGTGR